MTGTMAITKYRRVLLVLLAVTLAAGWPQSHAASPPLDYHIVSARLENGDHVVRIVYRHAPDIVERVADQQVSFDDPIISEDRLSVGWSIEEHVDASYPVPGDITLMRNGKVEPWDCLEDRGGGAADGWRFLAGGKQAVVTLAFEHGLPYAHSDLIDLDTGRCLGHVDYDNTTGKPPADAPAWARN